MREQATQFPNPVPPVVLTAPWRIAEVQALPNYCLKVRFLDGVEGIVAMSHLVMDEDAGVFTALRDQDLFAQVYLDYGAVTWPGEIDLAPDAMYNAIKAHGAWVLS
ncbi:MAG: DUF2442 domain-containing protein [Magnetococcales bacterium]|nr:DUF2442 domain-containing protein [Magnetococcales bacterium]